MLIYMQHAPTRGGVYLVLFSRATLMFSPRQGVVPGSPAWRCG